MLTDAQIRKATAPASGITKLSDGKGLLLLIAPSGLKTWRLRYYLRGEERQVSLGAYPAVSLAQARIMREEARAGLRQGATPASRRHDPEPVAKPAEAVTFEAVARRWHAAQRARWKPHHAKDVLDSLMADVFPTLGGATITAISAPDVLKVVRAVEPRSVDIARRLRQRVSAVFQHAIAEGVASADPAAGITKAMAAHVKGQRQAITDLDAARAMLRTVEEQPSHPVTKLAHRFLALTVVRPGELRWAAWDEFEGLDGEAPVWRIPGPRMKMKRPHVVPLAPAAVEILSAIQPLSTETLVFPSTRSSLKPISENAIGFLLNRAGFAELHVPHGWRATFSTVMNERSPADEAVIELMLAHAKRDKVAAAYNRTEHMERRRQLAAEWAGLLLADAAPAEQLLGGARR